LERGAACCLDLEQVGEIDGAWSSCCYLDSMTDRWSPP
jgi:hypothetical protein